MLKYIVKKFFTMIAVVLVVSFLSYMVLSLIPGDPAVMMLGLTATEEQIQTLHEELNLDKPLLVRYGIWLNDVLHGDLGRSLNYSSPVASVLAKRLPITFGLSIVSLVLGTIIGIFLGIISAVFRGKTIDSVICTFANLGISVPAFWIGVWCMYLFALKLNVLPVQGYVSPSEDLAGAILHAIMPCLVMSLGTIASLARQTRSAVLEEIHQNYVTTANAKGLKKWIVIGKHVLKNSLIPVLTLLGFSVRSLVGGSVIIEQLYNIPGMGRALVDGVNGRDITLVQGCILVIALVTVLSNFVVDIAYGIVDPRIRKEED